MRILFTAGRELDYVRNTILARSLNKFYPTKIVIGNSNNRLFRYFETFIKLLFETRQYDISIIGFYGTPFMILKPLLFKSKIIFDAFVFTYDTLCFDRKKINPNSLLGKFVFHLEKKSLENADHILVETNENKKYLNGTFNIPNHKITSVFVGCDENTFKINEFEEEENSILFYSTYQPLHGTDIIIKAASKIQSISDIQFHIYGNGQERKKCEVLAKQLCLKNLFFFDYVEYAKLPKIISASRICLAGPFGNTPKAKRVITGKTYQFLYLKKPVIVTKTSANMELLTHNWDAEFCEINNPDSLANSIEKLLFDQDYKNKIAINGYNTYLKKASYSIISSQISNIVKNL